MFRSTNVLAIPDNLVLVVTDIGPVVSDPFTITTNLVQILTDRLPRIDRHRLLQCIGQIGSLTLFVTEVVSFIRAVGTDVIPISADVLLIGRNPSLICGRVLRVELHVLFGGSDALAIAGNLVFVAADVGAVVSNSFSIAADLA